MAENNEKKRFGRRAGFGIGAIILITVAFYVSIFKGFPMDSWNSYSLIILGIIGFITGGLTLTDIFVKK